MILRSLTLLVTLLLFGAPPVSAQSGRLLVGGGIFNVLDGGEHDRLLLSVEYRAARSKWSFHPLMAVASAGIGAAFVSGGVAGVLPLGTRWDLSVGFAPTYHSAGGGTDLGHALEFYSFAEVGWRSGGGEFRARFGHMSNAGLGPYNPGAEIVQISYVLPPNPLFRRR